MSYEGVEQFICPTGHFYEIDSSEITYGNADCKCPMCESEPAIVCSVDYTNGYYEDDPRTFDGPKEEIGFEDECPAEPSLCGALPFLTF